MVRIPQAKRLYSLQIQSEYLRFTTDRPSPNEHKGQTGRQFDTYINPIATWYAGKLGLADGL